MLSSFVRVFALLFLAALSASAQMSVVGSVSPRQVSYIGTTTFSASASGGDPATMRYAFFRRRPGGTWIPDVNAPAWQPGSSYNWNPTLSDVGVWETYVWVKDGSTPPNMNTYGYAAGHNSQPIEVFGPPTPPGPTTVSCAYAQSGECWVTGDFTASVSASTGGLGSLSYQICRSNDTTGWGGCDVNLTLNGGTSITVSGSQLPADGYRRAYYFLARDSAGALGAWNTPLYVRTDRYGPSVSATNASEDWFASRTATVSASDAGSGVQAVRYSWNTALDAACTAGTATSPGATLTAPAGDNTLYLCAKDNVSRVTQWSGRYRVTAALSLACSVGPARESYVRPFTWTASASGGNPSTTRFAFFRRRPGGTWVPDVAAPSWQAGNTYAWTPSSTDAGVWETYVWVKDGNTPANQNTYGYAAGCNPGPIEVVGKPTLPGPTTVACAYATGDDCWVTGSFTASVTASTGGMGSLVYQVCRSEDSTGGFAGCPIAITTNGGTSIEVTGTHLPSDGYRRSYWFQARDSAGALSGWNTPRYVRVDRYAPTISATNASEEWFASRTATVSASDAGSGVQAVRYSWNTALDASCTTGTATSPGAMLTAPAGDNTLYLCAKDNVSRVMQWTGRYRVEAVAAPQVASVSPKVIQQGTEAIVTVTGSNLQGASVYVATQPAEGKPAPLHPFPVAELLGINAEGTALTVRIDAREAGIEGFQNLAVDTPGGRTAGQFRVVGTAPVVDAHTPSQPVQGNIHILMLAGINLQGAEVVPVDPAVKVLDLDNANDDMLMGLLYVDSNAATGPSEIRIERPGGGVLTLSIEVMGSAAAATVTTTQLEIPGRTGLADVPDVLMQTPVTSSSLLAGGIKRATDRSTFCPIFWAQESVQRSYILLGLSDLFGKPLTRQALNRLVPGQRLDFDSLTVAAKASAELNLYFEICPNWTTFIYACASGTASFMVPAKGGYSLEFDACIGSEGPRVELAAEGAITKHEWSTSSSCVTVQDSHPESESGERRGRIAVDCCTPTDVYLHINASALQQSYDIQGRAMSIKQENCTNPSPPELRVFLDVDSDNLKEVDHLYLPEELDDSARYLPCSPLGTDGVPPGAGVPPNQLPQQTTVIAAYVQSFDGKLKIVPPPPGVTSIEIALQQTSKLNGIATNFPPDPYGGTGTTNADPDFWLGGEGAASETKQQSVTVGFGNPAAPSSVAVASLYCNDYGGSTRIHARPPEGAFSAGLAVPVPALGSGKLPAIGWTAVDGAQVQSNMQDSTDEDTKPAASPQRGDGLSAHSEYRGVVVDRRHYRLDPSQKDLFIEHNGDFDHVGRPSNLGLKIHEPRTEELLKWDTQVPDQKKLWVNVHGVANGMDTQDVVAIRLVKNDTDPLPSVVDPDDPPQLGQNFGEVSEHGAVMSVICTRRISQFRDRYPQRLPEPATLAWVFAHEIGHAVDMCHRDEDEHGNSKEACPDGAEVDPEARIPNDVFYMHGGDIFRRIGISTNGKPAASYHSRSLFQIKLK